MKQTIKIITILMLLGSPLFSQQKKVDSLLQQYDKHWQMQAGLYRVMQDGKMGVVDDTGNVIVPCRFDQVWTPTKNNFIRVLLKMKTGLYHLEKGIILPAEYDQIWEFDQGLAKVMKNRKFGFVNTDGSMVIPCEYQHVWEPENGRIKVIQDGRTGYVSTSGEIIAPPVYQHIWAFEDGQARVIRNGKTGFIDENGNEVVPAIYDHVRLSKDGRTMLIKDGQYFKLNSQGEITEISAPPENDEQKNRASENQKKQPRIQIEKDYIDIRHESGDIRISGKSGRRSFFNGHLSGIGLASNGYLNSDQKTEVPEGYAFMDLHQSKSLEVSIYPVEKSLRLIGGWFGITTGLGLQYNNYHFEIETMDDIDGAGREWFPEIGPDASISKSKLMVMHGNVPVMAELQINDRQNHNTFYLSGGVIGGVRLQTHTKVVYHNDEGRRKKKKRGDMGMPLFRYGFMARAGVDNFSLYATYYPEPMFKSGEGPELFPYSLGVMFSFD